MAKADFNQSSEYIKVPCKCHPETCACGGTKTIKNKRYKKFVKPD